MDELFTGEEKIDEEYISSLKIAKMDEENMSSLKILGVMTIPIEVFSENEKMDEEYISSLKIAAVKTEPINEEFTGIEKMDEDTSILDIVVKTEPLDEEFNEYEVEDIKVKEEIYDYPVDDFVVIEDFEVFETMIADGSLEYKLDMEPSREEFSEDEIASFVEENDESDIDEENLRATIPYIDYFGGYISYREKIEDLDPEEEKEPVPLEKIEEPEPEREKEPVPLGRRANKRTNSIQEREKKIPKKLTSVKKRENKKMTKKIISPVLETLQEKRENKKLATRMISPVPTRMVSPVPKTKQEKRENKKLATRMISPVPTRMISPVPTRMISPVPKTNQEKRENKKLATRMISPVPTRMISLVPTRMISPVPKTNQEKRENKKMTFRAIPPVSETLKEEVITIIDMGYDFYFTIAYNQVVRNASVFKILNGANMSLEELTAHGLSRNRLDYFKKFKEQFLFRTRTSEPLDDHLYEDEHFQSSNNQNISENTRKKFKYYRGMKSCLLDFYSQITGNNNSCVTFTKTIKKAVTPLEKRIEFSIKYSELNDAHDFFKSHLKYDHILKCEQVHVWTKKKYIDASSVEMFRKHRPFLGFIDLYIFIRSKVDEPEKDLVPFPIPMKVWTCQVCRYETTVYGHFVAHFLMKTTVYTYLCRRCGFLKFTNICSLLYHIFIDSKEDTWVEMCLACGKQFPSLTCHLTEQPSQSEILKCTSCGFMTKNKCIFDYHNESHQNLFTFCRECVDVFCGPHDLLLHKLFCVEKYTYFLRYCPACKIYFSDASHFQIHIQFEHYTRINYCSFCKIGFRTVDLIKRHVNEVHPNGYHRILNLCTICPQNTFRKERQEDHFSSHAKEERFIKKAYYCKCGFIAIEKGKFSQHIFHCTVNRNNRPKRSLFLKVCTKCKCLKSYNFSEPYVCEKCQICTDEKRYICTKCDLVIPYDFGIFLDHFLIKHPAQKKPPVSDTSFQIIIINNGELSHCKSTINVSQKGTELMHFTSPINYKAKTDRKLKTDFALPKNQKIITFNLMNNLKK